METTYNYSGQEDLLQDSLGTPPVYAGFWLRFAAYIIDTIIMYAFSSVLTLTTGGSIIPTTDGPIFTATQIIISLIGAVAGILYFVLMESGNWQATVGKRAVGIKVTDLDGNRIGFGRAIGRYFAKLISAIILLIGFIMAGFTERKQALHDMICGTLVVKA